MSSCRSRQHATGLAVRPPLRGAAAVAALACCLTAAVPPVSTAGETVAADARRARFTAVDLGTLGGVTSWAVAGNERGQVVGHSTTPWGDEHAFRWDGGRMRDLGTLPGGRTSSAAGLDERGLVVGTSGTPRGDRPFVWRHGRMAELPTPPGTMWGGAGAARGGLAVGWSVLDRPLPDGCRCHLLVWDISAPGPARLTRILPLEGGHVPGSAILNRTGLIVYGFSYEGSRHGGFGVWNLRDPSPRLDGMVDHTPAAVNDRGTIAGTWGEPYNRAFVLSARTGGRPRYLTDGTNLTSKAVDVNNDDEVVGFTVEQYGGHRRALVYRDGVVRRLGTLGGDDSVAEAVNDAGTVVGASSDTARARHLFLWNHRAPYDMVDLGTIGRRGVSAVAVMNRDLIVANTWGSTPQDRPRAAVWMPRP